MPAEMKKRGTIKIWAVLVWLAVWEAASLALRRGSLMVLLAAPSDVLLRLTKLCVAGEFWASVGFSLLRIGGGFFTALALGVLCAVLAARYPRAEELLAPAMLAIRTVPVASFIILALLLFSARNLALLISCLMALPVLYANTLSGIRAADPQLLEMARVFRVSPWRRARYLYLPQAMPHFRAGCGVALGLCWKAGTAAEVIGMPSGSIGEHLQRAKVYLDMTDLFAWTLVIVLASLVFERAALFLLERAARRLGRAGL